MLRNQYSVLKIKLFARAWKQKKVTLRKIFNVFRCSLAYLLKTAKSSASPYILSLELSNECNANCLFCRDEHGEIYDLNPSGSGITKGKMPLAMAKEIISQLKDDVLIAVLYTNGEPLMYKELPAVIKYATDKNVASMIATNGLLLTPEKVEAILEAGIDFIKLQLSGFTQEVYSVQVRRGDVDKLKENIHLLVEMNRAGNHNAVIMMDFMLYNYNKHELDLVRRFCNGLGIMLNVRPGNPKGGLEDLEPVLSDGELPLKISCDWLWKGMQVNFNGDILLCCDGVVYSGTSPYDTFEIGKTNVKDVWNGANAKRTRKTMARKGRKAMHLCSQCYRKGVHFKW